MNVAKLLKALIAITAAGLMLAAQTGCNDRKPETPASPSADQAATRAVTGQTPVAKPDAPPADAVPAPAADTSAASKPSRIIELSVTGDGFVPNELKVKKGEPLVLRVTRKTDETCATDLLIQDTSIKVALPLFKAVDIPYTPTKAGQIKFGCAMGMMVSGVLTVEDV